MHVCTNPISSLLTCRHRVGPAQPSEVSLPESHAILRNSQRAKLSFILHKRETQKQDKGQRTVCNTWSKGHIWVRTGPFEHISNDSEARAWLPPGLDCKRLIRAILWKLLTQRDSLEECSHYAEGIPFLECLATWANQYTQEEDGKSGVWSGFQTAPCRPVSHKWASRQGPVGAC